MPAAVSGLRQHYDVLPAECATASSRHTTKLRNRRQGRVTYGLVSLASKPSRSCDYLTDDLLAAVLRSVTR